MIYWPEYSIGRSHFAELRTMQREMNRLFQGPASGAPSAFPPLNLYSNGEEAVLKAEVPGLSAEGIDISVENDRLTIKGERKPEELEEGLTRLRGERQVGAFSRSVQLPWDVDNDKVKASYKQGVLTVRLPRSEVSKPKRIQIEAA